MDANESWLDGMRRLRKERLEAQRIARIQQMNVLAQAQPPRDVKQAVREWWEELAPETRNHPWGLEQIISEAFKNTSRPQYGQLGLALRALGWTPRRAWTVASRNRRTWHPPQE